MSDGIECPHCGESFDVTEQMRANIEKTVRASVTTQIREDLEKKYDARINDRLESKDDEIKHLEATLKQVRSESKDLKSAKRELEEYKEEQEDLIAEEVRKARRDEKQKLKSQFDELVNERLKEGLGEKTLKIQQLELHAQRQAKIIKDLQDAAQQSHGELQGESLEKAVFSTLNRLHPLDTITEIKKGTYGADIEHYVRTNMGATAGKILYECKFAKNWQDDWVQKIRSDGTGFDILVIVSTVLPAGMDNFGVIDDVFICRFHEIEVVSNLLKFAIEKTNALKTREEHKETIQERVVNYISGPEFSFVMTNIMNAYNEFEESIRTEENYMKRVWKKRRKQLQSVTDSMTNMLGTLEAIGGAQFSLEGFERPQLEESVKFESAPPTNPTFHFADDDNDVLL